jgi:hypothetical protein
MFDSQCEGSTDIFVVTFGGDNTLRHGLEMVRLVKKNFNMRLMVRLNHPIAEPLYAQIYAAGADLVEIAEITPRGEHHFSHNSGWESVHEAATAAFPRWAIASPLTINGSSSKLQMRQVDDLLRIGIVPLPRLKWDGTAEAENESCAVLHHLTKSWRQHKVAIKPFMPLICLNSPLTQARKPGALRALFDRVHERHRLATSDLLRHLRVSAPTDSMDSAEL